MSTARVASLALSVVIPVLNAERDLPGCLESIRRQRVPTDTYEIIVADGGSVDRTRYIAERAGARVINNPFGKAEPGCAVGVQASLGQFVIVMAADNRMHGVNFVERMLAVFDDPAVVAAFPRVISTPDDPLVARYFNRYSDPFNAFLYGTFDDQFDRLRRQDTDLTVSNHPLLGVSQGCSFRSGRLYQGPPSEADDVLAIIELIEQGGKLVFVDDAEIEHHHLTSLASAFRKYTNRTREAINGRQGYRRRSRHLSASRRLKRWLWVPYSASLVAPAIHGVLLALRHRDPLLLYHPVVNAVIFAAVLRGALPSNLR